MSNKQRLVFFSTREWFYYMFLILLTLACSDLRDSCDTSAQISWRRCGFPTENFTANMLRRILPFGLARHHAQAEPFFDQQSRPIPATVRQVAGRNASHISSRNPGSELNNYALLPEDVLFIILGYLTVAELLVTRQVS